MPSTNELRIVQTLLVLGRIGATARSNLTSDQVIAAIANPLMQLRIPNGYVITAQSFVQPKFGGTNYGGIPRLLAGQRYRPGMAALVRTEQAAWGNVTKVRDYVGVIVARGSSNTYIRPLAGASNNPSTVRLSGYIRCRLGLGVPIEQEELLQCVPNSSVALADPARLSEAWYAAANGFAQLRSTFNKTEMRNRLYARLSAPYRSICDEYRKCNNSSPDWKKQKVKAAQVRDTLNRLTASLAAEDLDVASLSLDLTAINHIALRVFTQRTGVTLRRLDCGHAAYKQVWVTGNHGVQKTSCQCCANLLRQALDSSGTMQYVARNCEVFAWADGTSRTVAEPPIIGSYHSSKSKFGKLPRLDGTPFHGLTMGFELEMECHPKTISASSSDNTVSRAMERAARLVQARMIAARPAGWETTTGPLDIKNYAFFERDSSVINGFEMVTSYGSLDVHRHYVYKMFGSTDKEKLPFLGILRSHDATASCGLHVHMTKPEVLGHAVKLQAFYHDRDNIRLIRAVARRYATAYAQADDKKGTEYVRAVTKRAAADGGREWAYDDNNGRDRSVCNVSRAITALTPDRRDMVNFSNGETVEIRVFKGTMLPTSIMACLEFSQATWFFARDHKAEDMTTHMFLKYISMPTHRHDTGNLRAYLMTRGFDVFMPRTYDGTVILETEFNCEES
jgi:hypothetical protein